MILEAPDTDEADAIADQWVALAAGQRAHGSHLRAADNRERVRAAVVRHVVAGGLLVARDDRLSSGKSEASKVSDVSEVSDVSTDDRSDLVGFVMFSLETAGFEQDVTRGFVENLYVRPERRGEGVGSALLAAAEDALRDRGADAVALDVMATNADARRFYHRYGYAPHRVELEKSVGDEVRSGPTESDTDSKDDR